MAFAGSSYINIDGGARNEVYGDQINITHGSGRDDILKSLAALAAINATRDAEERFPPPNCHPGTRVKVLTQLGRWIEEQSAVTTRIHWVHGSAGVGKSAIAQKISEDHGRYLVATFFFSRNDSTRDKLDRFVATIAYQCCTSEALRDVVGPHIIEAIRSDPHIFLTSSENQFRKLILEPFSKVPQHIVPNLIVIDGLDECVDIPSQGRLIRIVDDAIAFPTPHPFTFLLCSRPEPHILSSINRASFGWCLERIPISYETTRDLDRLSDSDRDIQKYFTDQFRRLRDEHPALRHEESWPNENDVLTLVYRASGQFIFAVTVVKYVDTPDELPQDRLDTILNANLSAAGTPDSPYSELDLLYRQILSNCRKWEKVYPLLRLLVTPDPASIAFQGISLAHVSWHSPLILSKLLKYRTGEVETLLSGLHSVLQIPDDIGWDIHIPHASLTEFLQDKNRSGDYYVPRFSRVECCDLVATLLINTSTSFIPIYPLYCSSSQSSFDIAFINWKGHLKERNSLERFSVIWSRFCIEIDSPSTGLLEELDLFDPYTAAAMFMSTDRSDYEWHVHWLGTWIECVTWAKSLRGPQPLKFIKRMESFFQGFYVGFSKDIPRHIAIWRTFLLEYADVTSRSDPLLYKIFQVHLIEVIRAYFRQWWSEPALRNSLGPFFPLVLPAASKFPDDWAVAHITEGNRELMQRIYDIYNKSLLSTSRWIFNRDVIDDTTHSVNRGLIKQADLLQFKAILYQRRRLFAMLDDGSRRNSNPGLTALVIVPDIEAPEIPPPPPARQALGETPHFPEEVYNNLP